MSQPRRRKMPDNAKQAIKDLREFYRQGAAAPQGRNHGKGEIAAAAKVIGINQDTLRKARVFANSEVGYSRVDFDELIRRLKAHEYSENGWFFGQTHIIRLISVKDHAERKVLQDDVIDGEWSCAQLDDVIRQRYGNRKQAGRRRRVPRERSALLSQVAHECDRWNRWWRSLNRLDGESSPLQQLPNAVQSKLSEAIAAIEKLGEAANQASEGKVKSKCKSTSE